MWRGLTLVTSPGHALVRRAAAVGLRLVAPAAAGEDVPMAPVELTRRPGRAGAAPAVPERSIWPAADG